MLILIIHITAILADPQAPLRDQLAEYKMEVNEQVTTASRTLDRCNVALMDAMIPMEVTRKFAKWAVTDFQDVLQENEELQKRIVERAKGAEAKMSQIRSSVTPFIVDIETILAEEDEELKARIDEAKELLHANDKLAAGMILDYQEAERLKASILENTKRVQQGAIDALWRNECPDVVDPELTTEELSSMFRTEDVHNVEVAELITILDNMKGRMNDHYGRLGVVRPQGGMTIHTQRLPILGTHSRPEERLAKMRELEDGVAPILNIIDDIEMSIAHHLSILAACRNVLDGLPGAKEIGVSAKSKCVDSLGRSLRLLAAGHAPAVHSDGQNGSNGVRMDAHATTGRMNAHYDEVDGMNVHSSTGTIMEPLEHSSLLHTVVHSGHHSNIPLDHHVDMPKEGSPLSSILRRVREIIGNGMNGGRLGSLVVWMLIMVTGM